MKSAADFGYGERHASSWRPNNTYRNLTAGILTLLLLSSFAHWNSWQTHHTQLSDAAGAPNVAAVQQCAIDNLRSDLSFLDAAKSIEADEFLERRDRLAQALAINGVDAFVLEPGYTFQSVPHIMLFNASYLTAQILWQHLPTRLGTMGA